MALTASPPLLPALALRCACGVVLVQVLSGNVTIETAFYDGELLVSKNRVRVFYDL